MTCKLVVLLLLFAAASAHTDWCNFVSLGNCKKGAHTLCVYPAGPAKRCLAKGDLGAGLSDEHKRIIVNMHNQLRLTVASGNERRGSNGPQPASKSGRMPNLQWDDSLAAIAQRWADQCDYGHDYCRSVPAHYVGQSCASWYGTDDVKSIDIINMVNSWYNEVEHFDRNEVRKFSGHLYLFNGNAIGHYVQFVWAETTKIGCGLRNYYEGGLYRHYLVCNYGPGGNYPGQAIYET